MEVKKLEQIDATIVANGVEAMGCDTDCPHVSGNIIFLFNCDTYFDQAISDDF